MDESFPRDAPFYLNPTSFARKLREWAWAIGRDDLLADSTRAFVAHQLRVTDLDQLLRKPDEETPV